MPRPARTPWLSPRRNHAREELPGRQRRGDHAVDRGGMGVGTADLPRGVRPRGRRRLADPADAHEARAARVVPAPRRDTRARARLGRRAADAPPHGRGRALHRARLHARPARCRAARRRARGLRHRSSARRHDAGAALRGRELRARGQPGLVLLRARGRAHLARGRPRHGAGRSASHWP